MRCPDWARRLGRRLREDDGDASLEMLMCFPAALLLVFLVVDACNIYFAKTAATTAAREAIAGARGYIMKEEATDRVLAALRRVLRGEIWVSDDVGARLLQKLSKGGAPAQSSPLAGLTDRELVIFRMLGLGLSVREIAEKLNLSTKTVDTHRDRIKEKLNFKSSLELLRYAIVVTLDES